jgi:hypothetical protein
MHVNPIEFILTAALIGVFFYMQRKKKLERAPQTKPGAGVKPGAPPAPRAPKPVKPPEEVFADLRRQAFATDPSSLGLSVQENEPYGCLMELGLPSSIVTLLCFANGDASLYYQTGGGMTGGGVHDAIRRAAKEFVALSGKALPQLSPTADQPLPQPDTVRFYVMTPKAIFTTETFREDLGDPQSVLGALFYSGQEVVTKMRQVQQQRASDPPS